MGVNDKMGKVMYIFTLALAEFIFLIYAKKRKNFCIRFLGGFLLLGIASYFFDKIQLNGQLEKDILSIVFFISGWILSVAICFFSYKGKIPYIVDMCLVAYAVQHIVNKLSTAISIHYKNAGIENLFTHQLFLSAVFTIIVYAAVFFLFIYKKRYGEELHNYKTTLVSIPILIICITLNRWSIINALSVYELGIIWSIVCCIFTILLQTGFLIANKNLMERQMMEKQLQLEREKYEMWNDSINFINMRFHDLKSMMANLYERYDEQMLREAKEAISIYDNTIRSGNKIADLLLYEKNRYCEEHGIDFTYMIDGALLNHLKKEDVFILLTNIINNAIEGVGRLEDRSKRVINLKITKNANFLMIDEENYCHGELKGKDGFLQTEKKNKELHGYGLKSISSIATKYGGTMDFSVENSTFHLLICIPIDQAN